MSLRDAVEEVIKDMEAEDYQEASRILRPYVKMLKMALKASESSAEPVRTAEKVLTHADIIEMEKQKMRRTRKTDPKIVDFRDEEVAEWLLNEDREGVVSE